MQTASSLPTEVYTANNTGNLHQDEQAAIHQLSEEGFVSGLRFLSPTDCQERMT